MKPKCQIGYTKEELESNWKADCPRIVDDVPAEECKGMFFDPERQKYFFTDCGPHGTVFPFRLVNKWLEEHQLQSSQ